jgi:hypothetical protein
MQEDDRFGRLLGQVGERLAVEGVGAAEQDRRWAELLEYFGECAILSSPAEESPSQGRVLLLRKGRVGL